MYKTAPTGRLLHYSATLHNHNLVTNLYQSGQCNLSVRPCNNADGFETMRCASAPKSKVELTFNQKGGGLEILQKHPGGPGALTPTGPRGKFCTN